MTNEEKAAFLAMGVMGWRLDKQECPDHTLRFWDLRDVWMDKNNEPACQAGYWFPHKDRNQLAMVEAKLTDEQWDDYMQALGILLRTWLGRSKVRVRDFRTADPAVCVDAIIEAVRGETES